MTKRFAKPTPPTPSPCGLTLLPFSTQLLTVSTLTPPKHCCKENSRIVEKGNHVNYQNTKTLMYYKEFCKTVRNPGRIWCQDQFQAKIWQLIWRFEIKILHSSIRLRGFRHREIIHNLCQWVQSVSDTFQLYINIKKLHNSFSPKK